MLNFVFVCFSFVLADLAVEDKECFGSNGTYITTETDCYTMNAGKGCKWNVRFNRCWVGCNSEIYGKGDDGRDSTVFVNNETGADYFDGSSDSKGADGKKGPLRTIEQAKKCYGRNTLMNLSAGTFELTPPANLSTNDENLPNPYFKVCGNTLNTTLIKVVGADYEDLHIESENISSTVLYVYKATFEFSNVTIEIGGVGVEDPDNDHSSLVWIHDASSVVKFVDTKFNGTIFPKHLFVHTGGNLTLENVIIDPPSELSGNIVYWFGSSSGAHHSGSWVFNNVELVGPLGNIAYTYPESLFEQAFPADKTTTLAVTFSNSTFKNIAWNLPSTTSIKRRNNVNNPRGLVFAVDRRNEGKVTVSETSFRGINVSTVPFAAPIAIGWDVISNNLVINSVIFENNIGNSAGAIVTNANIKITGKSVFENNTVVETNAEGIPQSIGGKLVIKPNARDFGTTETEEARKPTVELSKDTVGGVSDMLSVKKEGSDVDDGTKWWVVVVVIVVAVVIVAGLIVVIALGVFFHKKKYQTLSSDENYDESSSNSLNDTKKDNEMDSV